MILEGKGLVKAFGGLTAVGGFDITVRSGEVVGLIGPNGAGKSTVVNLLSGTLPLTKGRVFLDGRDITATPVHTRARMGITRTFQLNSVWKQMTVRQSLETAYYCQRTKGLFLRSVLGNGSLADGWSKDAADLLEMLDITSLRDRKLADLTYGHQRMASIAAALMTKPGILLLDEPVAGMNWEESVHLLEAVQRIMTTRQLGVLLIEHNVQAVAKFASRVVAMSFGKRLEEGSAEQVMSAPSVIEAYLGRQGDHAAG